eukprot:gene5969-17635_t
MRRRAPPLLPFLPTVAAAPAAAGLVNDKVYHHLASQFSSGFAMFQHFGAAGRPSAPCSGGRSLPGGRCLSPSHFNPTNLSAVQWMETARALGADEVCLTAHHEQRPAKSGERARSSRRRPPWARDREGGFALWPAPRPRAAGAGAAAVASVAAASPFVPWLLVAAPARRPRRGARWPTARQNYS